MDEFQILEQIADSYDENSVERKVLSDAAMALHSVKNIEAHKTFHKLIIKKNTPLNGIELIHLKMCGLEIPEKHKTEITTELEAEIENLSQKINELNR
ncbi:MAG: hypothetical protein HRT89_03280 [Lentisphaeria bacterium]|nr:hypothetical protein [Lentisphaeria bacterium]NQZ67073.1 hypothetical protein [Lentisphaeria bacterium]